MSTKKVNLKEREYKEVITIFKKLTTAKIPPYEQFKKNLDMFFELTYEAYVLYGGGTTEAILNWIEFIGSENLASEYFRAVDSWHAYT
jgi:hypothetical protein